MSKKDKYRQYETQVFLSGGEVIVLDLTKNPYERLLNQWKLGVNSIFRTIKGNEVIHIRVTDIVAVHLIKS